ncbi:unnamed protein product [Linum tenue]|uniref:Uncharacterized protein n=1 Tax=Linum tenue TaxID=586396 RepID=A0AAV0PFX1_9ROSI|nr:unnamed protein product [Linum tenue]
MGLRDSRAQEAQQDMARHFPYPRDGRRGLRRGRTRPKGKGRGGQLPQLLGLAARPRLHFP